MVSAQNAVDYLLSRREQRRRYRGGSRPTGSPRRRLADDAGGTGTAARNRIGRSTPTAPSTNAFNPGANSSCSRWPSSPMAKILVGGGFTMIGGGCSPSCTGDAHAHRAASGRRQRRSGLQSRRERQHQSDRRAAERQESDSVEHLPALAAPYMHVCRSGLARLNADGTVDATFDRPEQRRHRQCHGGAADGKILIGGFFTTIGAADSAPRRAATSRASKPRQRRQFRPARTTRRRAGAAGRRKGAALRNLHRRWRRRHWQHVAERSRARDRHGPRSTADSTRVNGASKASS